MHKLIITNVEPNVYSTINVSIIKECYRGMTESDRERIIKDEILSQEDIDNIPDVENATALRELRKTWVDAKIDINKEVDKDKPLFFNLIMNILN